MGFPVCYSLYLQSSLLSLFEFEHALFQALDTGMFTSHTHLSATPTFPGATISIAHVFVALTLGCVGMQAGWLRLWPNFDHLQRVHVTCANGWMGASNGVQENKGSGPWSGGGRCTCVPNMPTQPMWDAV